MVYFYWISIIVLHIFIMLMLKGLNLMMIYSHMWHCCLGHIGVKRMKKLHSDGLLESLDFESFDTCEPCLMGKMTRTSFSGSTELATDLLEIMHSNVCGPMSVSTQ